MLFRVRPSENRRSAINNEGTKAQRLACLPQVARDFRAVWEARSATGVIKSGCAKTDDGRASLAKVVRDFSRRNLASRAVPEPHGRRLSAKRTIPHRLARCRLKSRTIPTCRDKRLCFTLSGLIPLLITPGTERSEPERAKQTDAMILLRQTDRSEAKCPKGVTGGGASNGIAEHRPRVGVGLLDGHCRPLKLYSSVFVA